MSYVVVTSVAAVTGVEPSMLPPLGRYVETDALDVLFADRTDCTCSLSFRYAGCDITVERDGSLRIVVLDESVAREAAC